MVNDGPVSYLMLSCGTMYSGYSVGVYDVVVAEICFTTSMFGYQHSISDPSFASQIIVFTFPHIGNVGINDLDNERSKIFTSGVVFRNKIVECDHYLKKVSFDDWLKKNNVVGIYGIDTRKLTKMIASCGTKNAVIFPAYVSKELAMQKLDQCANMVGMELTQQVSFEGNFVQKINKKKRYPELRIAIVDFGVKNSIINELDDYFEIYIIKAKQGLYDEILKHNVDGIVLSNGPGDPAATSKMYADVEIKKILLLNVPIIGICLGHQLIALSLGFETYKLKNQHRGTNHPVYNVKNKSVEISTQNHGFVVSNKNIPDNVEITHYSLFDESIEGIAIKNKPIFSVQYHPEASPGPHDSKYIFKQFIDEVTFKKYGSLC